MSRPTPVNWAQRQRVWAHNALYGATAMSVASMHRIIDAPTTTSESKAQALALLGPLADLYSSLKTRVDI